MIRGLGVERRFSRVDIGTLLLPLIDGPHRLLDAARASRESEALDTPLPDDVHRALVVGQSDEPGEG